MSGWYGNVHIYAEPGQPLTKFRLYPYEADGEELWDTTPPYKLYYCHNCGRLRAAKDLNVHVYYDHVSIVCAQKEYARSPEFPFAYERVCAGYTYRAVHQ